MSHNRAPGKRVLVVDARVPTPDMDGGSLRMVNLLSILKRLSYDVSFAGSFVSSWPPFSARLDRDVARLQQIGVRVFAAPEIESAEQLLQENGPDYDLILLSGGVHYAQRHIDNVRRYAPRATVLFDTVDLNHLREYREAKLAGNRPHLLRALHTKQLELSVARKADYTLVVSPDEKRILEQECPELKVRVITNIHAVPGSRRAFSERRDILFLGAFQHTPNVDAACHLAEDIMPLIREALPGVKLYLVGSNPPDTVAALAAPDVVVTGYVPDLDPYLDGCRLSVAPLRFGAGVKGKLLLSMSGGLPAVASSIAAEGLYATPGRDLLVADQPADFCAQVAALYRDEALWSSLSQNGINLVEEHFSFRAVQSEVEKLFAEFDPSLPLVSVIIPVYNGRRFLAEALHSILDQDYRPIEVIVVDDGSTDRSFELVQSFEGIRTICQPNRGVAAARNAGIESAQGEFIAFLDQDDTWTPDKLTTQVGYLLKHPAVGYVLAHQKLFLIEGVARPSWLRPELLEKPPVGYLPGTLVARTRLFRQVGLFDTAYKMGSDSDWFFRTKGAGVSMAILPEVLLHRKIHSQNQSYETITAHRELFSILRRSIHQEQSGGPSREEE